MLFNRKCLVSGHRQGLSSIVRVNEIQLIWFHSNSKCCLKTSESFQFEIFSSLHQKQRKCSTDLNSILPYDYSKHNEWHLLNEFNYEILNHMFWDLNGIKYSWGRCKHSVQQECVVSIMSYCFASKFVFILEVSGSTFFFSKRWLSPHALRKRYQIVTCGR